MVTRREPVADSSCCPCAAFRRTITLREETHASVSVLVSRQFADHFPTGKSVTVARGRADRGKLNGHAGPHARRVGALPRGERRVCFTDDRWRRNLERPARKCQREARCGQRSLGEGLLGCGKQGNDLPHHRRRKLEEDSCAGTSGLDSG